MELKTENIGNMYCERLVEKTIERKKIVISILTLTGLFFNAPMHAQESCYEQYLREHNKQILTAEDADDSYDELKKTVLARQMYGDSYLLMVDTIAQRAVITKVDGTYVADVHVALVDSTWYMWLSVDPLADKYPGNTPYMYCNGNPIMLIDPDGMDPIYKRVSKHKVERIGDTGEEGNSAFLVSMSLAKKVEKSENPNNYRGLEVGRRVVEIPKGDDYQAVENTLNATHQSGSMPDNRVEHGGHSCFGGEPLIWDPGGPMIKYTAEDGRVIKKWRTYAFIKDGQRINVSYATIRYLWHVHPFGSDPSDADYNLLEKMKDFHGTCFLISDKQRIVTFYNKNKVIFKIDYDAFRKICTED